MRCQWLALAFGLSGCVGDWLDRVDQAKPPDLTVVARDMAAADLVASVDAALHCSQQIVNMPSVSVPVTPLLTCYNQSPADVCVYNSSNNQNCIEFSCGKLPCILQASPGDISGFDIVAVNVNFTYAMISSTGSSGTVHVGTDYQIPNSTNIKSEKIPIDKSNITNGNVKISFNCTGNNSDVWWIIEPTVTIDRTKTLTVCE